METRLQVEQLSETPQTGCQRSRPDLKGKMGFTTWEDAQTVNPCVQTGYQSSGETRGGRG